MKEVRRMVGKRLSIFLLSPENKIKQTKPAILPNYCPALPTIFLLLSFLSQSELMFNLLYVLNRNLMFPPTTQSVKGLN